MAHGIASERPFRQDGGGADGQRANMFGMTTDAASDRKVTFEAMVVPHRSMGRRGLRWLTGTLLVLSGGVSLGLWYAGAWPVIGFTGAEFMLIAWLLRRHAKEVRRTEMLLLSEQGLRVVRTDGDGRRWEQVLSSGWLRAGLEERQGRAPALMVHSQGAQLEVGAALGEQEKRHLAAALSTALDRQRNPVFDNPQLRDI